LTTTIPPKCYYKFIKYSERTSGAMILKFQGLVILKHECRCSDDGEDGSVWVGDKDVVDCIGSSEFKNPVTVAIADERFDGDLSVELGWGYSEYTPMDPDLLKVGSHDLIEILKRHEAKEITMWVSDEPVNTLE
jgi:hypothetical protein